MTKACTKIIAINNDGTMHLITTNAPVKFTDAICLNKQTNSKERPILRLDR
jgi:hypothetical protein